MSSVLTQGLVFSMVVYDSLLLAIIGLTVWTVDDGIEWVRNDVNGITGETMGKSQGIYSCSTLSHFSTHSHSRTHHSRGCLQRSLKMKLRGRPVLTSQLRDRMNNVLHPWQYENLFFLSCPSQTHT